MGIRNLPLFPWSWAEDAEEFPFLDDIRWVDFRNKNAYQKSFYDLVCAIENIVPGLGDAFDVKPGTPISVRKKIVLYILVKDLYQRI